MISEKLNSKIPKYHHNIKTYKRLKTLFFIFNRINQILIPKIYEYIKNVKLKTEIKK